MKHINANIYPRDGYFFKEKDGVRIGADSWAGVIKRVESYRKRANYPIGNVEEEVMAQACMRNPGICAEENGAYTAALTRASLKSRVLGWFLAMASRHAREAFNFVSEPEANSRANVCAGCPNNQALPDGCSSCRAAVEESRRGIIGGRNWDARVHACNVLGEDINTTRWTDMVREDNGALPGNCWRKIGT